MALQSEIVLLDPAEQPAGPKPRKTGARRAPAPKRAKRASSRKTSKAEKEMQVSGTDIVPVMKLRAIDMVDDAKPKNTGRGKAATAPALCPHVIQMPPSSPPQNPSSTPGETASRTFDIPTGADGEPLVTDPELLELLEQLSVTIDTANTVLDAASTVPADEEEIAGEIASSLTRELPDHKDEPAPQPVPEAAPEPEDTPETDTQDLPPLAARLAPETPPAPAPKKNAIGFGLLANTALTGLVFASGVAWVLHTNPWLLEGKINVPVQIGAPAAKPATKDQSTLNAVKPPPKRLAAIPGPVVLGSIAPPDDDPAPMETRTLPGAPKVSASEPSQGPAGQPIALNISLPPGQSGSEMSVMVQGVPDNAKLSAGKSLGSGNWLLNEPQLEDVTLNTGKDFKPGIYELEVILVRSDGKVPDTRKVSVTVEPVAVALTPEAESPATAFVKEGVVIQMASTPANPAPQTAMTQLAPQEVRMFLTRGDALMREGDVSGARLLLEYAANSGSKQAMIKLGNSYNPEHLAKLGVRGVRPNEAVAMQWYDRAVNSAAAK